jgi:hypothetical protein
MSALRFSGRVRVRVTLTHDRAGRDVYRCALTAFERTAGEGAIVARTIVHVHPPAFLETAIDAPEAFDDTARAALAFADADGHDRAFAWGEACAYASDMSDRHVGRSPASAFPRPEGRKVSILSIDAWRQPEGWTWNMWHKIGTCDVAIASLPPRRVLAFLRSEGVLGDGSRGRVRTRDDGYNVVIEARGTGEPLYAIAYGEADDIGIEDPEASSVNAPASVNVNAPEVQS